MMVKIKICNYSNPQHLHLKKITNNNNNVNNNNNNHNNNNNNNDDDNISIQNKNAKQQGPISGNVEAAITVENTQQY